MASIYANSLEQRKRLHINKSSTPTGNQHGQRDVTWKYPILLVPVLSRISCNADDDGNGNVEKSNRFNEQNTKSARASLIFCLPCTTTTRSGQILSLIENWNGKVSKFTWQREHLYTRARSPLFGSKLNSLLLKDRATWDNNEIISKDAKSTFQRCFHGRRRCRIVRSLMRARVKYLFLALSGFILLASPYRRQIVTIGPRGGGGWGCL